MAVTEDLKVTVQVHGQDLVEYDDDVTAQGDTKEVTKYVEAVSGANFSVVVEAFGIDRSLHDSWAPDIIIDGKVADRPLLCFQRRTTHIQRRFRGTTTYQNGCGSLQPWKFAEITEVENDDPTLPKKILDDIKHVGTISVLVRRCTSLGVQAPKDSDRGMSGEALTLREKEINKGGSLTHSTSLGKAEPHSGPMHDVHYIDTIESPYFQFHFKYRSRRALRSMLLIPRTPSPVPLEDRDVETLTQDEMRQVIRRQQQRQRDDNVAIRRLKREIKEEEDGMRRDLGKRSKIKPFTCGEIIDLID